MGQKVCKKGGKMGQVISQVTVQLHSVVREISYYLTSWTNYIITPHDKIFQDKI